MYKILCAMILVASIVNAKTSPDPIDSEDSSLSRFARLTQATDSSTSNFAQEITQSVMAITHQLIDLPPEQLNELSSLLNEPGQYSEFANQIQQMGWISNEQLEAFLKNNAPKPIVKIEDQYNFRSLSPELQEITLHICKDLSDGDLHILARTCPKLKKISLSTSINITDLGISYVAIYCEELEDINLSTCSKISDMSIIAISESCKNLKSLDLSFNQLNITDKAVQSLGKNSHNLEVLDLSHCYKVSDRGMIALASGCPGLKYLSCSNCSFTNEAVIAIGNYCLDLRLLNIMKCSVEQKAVTMIANNCSNLTHLYLGRCSLSDADALEAVQNATKLKVLKLPQAPTPEYLNSVVEISMNKQKYIDACY